MDSLKPEDLVGMEWIKEECLTCDCFKVAGCQDCGKFMASGPVSCAGNWPRGDCEPHECVGARMEARLAAYREALENLLNDNLALRDYHQMGDCVQAIHVARALLAAPDPGQGIVERLRAGKGHITALIELAAAKDDLLVAYRLSSQRLGDKALTRLEKAKAALAAHNKAVHDCATKPEEEG